MNKILSSDLIYTSSSNPFYDQHFRNMLDPHIHWLKTAGNVRHDVVVPHTHMGAFIGDFYAILQELGVAAKYHRIVMLVNGFTNPIQYSGQLEKITIPDTAQMDRLLLIYNTGRGNLLNGVPGE